MVQDIINNRINNPRHHVRSIPFITVLDLQKVERLIRAIAAAKGTGKHKIVEKVGAGIKRGYSTKN